MPGFKVIIDSITIVLYLVILLNKNAKLTDIALIFVAAYGVTLLISTPLLRANDRRVFEKKRELKSHFIEAVSNIETIKAIATEKLFFQQGVNRILKTQLAEFKGALIAFNIGLISNNQASTIVILGYGAFLVIAPTETGQNQLTPGELVAFNGLLGLLLTPLQSLIGVWDELQEMRISFERVNDVLVLPSEEQNRDVIFPPIQGWVRLEHVYFSYEGSESHILTDINLEVAPGEKIALVGKSGSGKTTLANLLTRLLQPTQGTILVDGMDLGNIDLSSYRRQLGVVEQNPFLFSGTIRENIARANPNADLDTVVAAAKLAGADEFIDSFPLKYDTQIGERGMTLSGGQRQRLVIARALLTDPSILILDEPTAALDSESERIMLENLEQQVAGRTTFMIAHRLSTVKNSDRIIVMDQGRIVEIGTHQELLEQRGLYFQLNNS